MLFTERFVILIAAGSLMIGFSNRVEILYASGIAFIVFTLILAVFDYYNLKAVGLVEAERVCDDKLSMGAENPIIIKLRNTSYTTYRISVKDEYPVNFSIAQNIFDVKLCARTDENLIQHVRVNKRGDYKLGNIYIRFKGRFGLLKKQNKYLVEKDIKVYPNLLDIKKYDINLKKQLILEAGQKVSRYRGRGTDFESLREYLPDDEYRSIDWKASARRGKMITRQYQEEKSQNVLIVLDCGRAMGIRTGELTRLDQSINSAMMLAHIVSSRGDKTGLISFGEDINTYSPPKAGRSQVINMLRLTYNLHDAEGDSNFSKAASYISKRWTRRSLVIVFTDISDPTSSEELIKMMMSLSKKHLCVCAVISSHAILESVYPSGEGVSDIYKSAAAIQMINSREHTKAVLRQIGVKVVDAPPEKLTQTIIDNYLSVKAVGAI